jgi:holo-[acyl-carrier protein] synthase
MAIYGVGLDLVRVDRLEGAVLRWGERFQERVFTDNELATCLGRKRWAACLAMRFAAKEAFFKALGTGLRGALSWRDIEVRSNELGKPEILLSERARHYCREQSITAWQVSLTDDGAYGAAVVILEG